MVGGLQRDRRKYACPEIDPDTPKPWRHLIPTLDDMQASDWVFKVKDWPMFWELFQRWLEYESDSGPPSWVDDPSEVPSAAAVQYLDPDHADYSEARQDYYEAWFDIKGREQVLAAITSVRNVVYDLEELGVPMPKKLVYLQPIGKFFKTHRARESIYEAPMPDTPEPEPTWEYPDKPWEDWDDFSFRVHTEKVKQKEEKYEAFMERLDNVGKYRHMEVTPETDLRLARHQPLGKHSDMPHEDIMNLITKDGTSADPFQVPVNIEDPRGVADIMKETKYHEETEDFIKNMGRWVDSEDDLPGMDEAQEGDDVTMNENFSNLGDAFGENGGSRGGVEMDTEAALGDEESATDTDTSSRLSAIQETCGRYLRADSAPCSGRGAFNVNTQEWARWGSHPLRKDYDVVMDLGEGAFSLVVLAKHKTIPGKLMALKVVYLQSPDMLAEPEHRDIMLREAEFLKRLQHPNIVGCEEVVNDGKQLVIVLEFLRGGQLYDQLEHLAGEHYTEQAAATLFAQMASAVQHLHAFGVMHRDIKGENFIFARDPVKVAEKGGENVIKLIDLGMAAEYNPKEVIKGALGSPGFVSPEVVRNHSHRPAMDIFSLGVVLFVMLVGRKPFSFKQCETLSYAETPLEDCPGLKDPRYLQLSDSAKDLLLCMMKYDPAARMTADQVMQHPWVAAKAGKVVKPLSVNVTKGAATTAAARRFRSLVSGIAAERALRPLPRGYSHAPDDDEGTKHSYTARLAKQKATASRTRGYRGDPSGRAMSRAEQSTFDRDARTFTELHDRGGVADSTQDISRHTRPHSNRTAHGDHSSATSQDASQSKHGQYYSIHGGRLRFEDPADAHTNSPGSQNSDKTVRGGGMRLSCSLSDLQNTSGANAAVQKWRRWGLGAHQMLTRQSSTPSTPSNSTHHLANSNAQEPASGSKPAVASIPEKNERRNSMQRKVNVIKPL
ncbi:hypothetical protein WJX73_003198 [Symbiochloris irregularis]|uniref:Protein kinase domain-containing protein n=1 Tax=Symbiochloris irregularis TaxID=706552 RepID=A0AAW1NQG1_9CHLO